MLIGKTVALRPAENRDLDLLFKWWNDPGVVGSGETRWPTRRTEIEARLAKKPNYDRRGEFLVVLAKTARSDDEVPVGHISYIVPMRHPLVRCYEIGYCTPPDHRRQGYTTMAARLLVNHLFAGTPIHRIQAHCRSVNEGSGKVMTGCGMTREAALRGFALVNGVYEDADLYSILRPEWSDAATYAERYGGL